MWRTMRLVACGAVATIVVLGLLVIPAGCGQPSSTTTQSSAAAPGPAETATSTTVVTPTTEATSTTALPVSSATTATPTTSYAEGVMQGFSETMKTVRGFHFVYQVDRPSSAQGSGFELDRLTGNVNAAGNMQATAEGTRAGKNVQQEVLIVDGTVYVQDITSAKWRSVAAAQSPVASLNLYRGMSRLPDHLTEMTRVGRTMASPSGKPSDQIKAMVDIAALADLIGPVSVSGAIPVDIWAIPDFGMYIYDLRITGALNPGEDPATVRTLSLSDYGESIDIQVPK
jgi:hypothetical protein